MNFRFLGSKMIVYQINERDIGDSFRIRYLKGGSLRCVANSLLFTLSTSELLMLQLSRGGNFVYFSNAIAQNRATLR